MNKIICDSWIDSIIPSLLNMCTVFQWINYSWTVVDFACRVASVYNESRVASVYNEFRVVTVSSMLNSEAVTLEP